MKNFVKQKTALLLSFTMVATQFLALPISTIKAAADPFQTCDEAQYSFDPSKPVSQKDTDITYTPAGDCANHLTGSLPNSQHIQPVESINHLPLQKTTVHTPTALQEHHYIFQGDSQLDNFYHRAWVKSFSIKLQPDLLATMQPGSLKCPVPDDHIDGHFDNGFTSCNYQNNQVWNGTKVVFDGTTITYTFGLHDNDPNTPLEWHKPILSGLNPGLDQGALFFGDTVNDWTKRAISMSIKFTSKDRSSSPENKNIWSASSTSRAQVIHEVIPKNAVDKIPFGLANIEDNKGKYHDCDEGGLWNASNSWCDPVTQPIGYHWVEIGTDVSIWKAPAKPANPAACVNLKLDSVDFIPGSKTLLENKPATVNVTPTFKNGSINVDYRWVAQELDLHIDPPNQNKIIFPLNNVGNQNPNNNAPLPNVGFGGIGVIGQGAGAPKPDNGVNPGNQPGGNGAGAPQGDNGVNPGLPNGGADQAGNGQGGAGAPQGDNGANPGLPNGGADQAGNGQGGAGAPQGDNGVNPGLPNGGADQAGNGAGAPNVPNDPAIKFFLLGGFKDDKGSNLNPKNPYLDTDFLLFGASVFGDDRTTYYTGGMAGTVVTVKAIYRTNDANNGKEVPNCVAHFFVVPKPAALSCDSLELVYPGPLNEAALPQNFDVTAKTSGGLQVDFKWHYDKPGLSFDGKANNDYIDIGNNNKAQTKIDDLDKQKVLNSPIVATVTAVDKSNPNQIYANCSKTITISPGNIQNPVCKDLGINKPEIKSVTNNTQTLFSVNPVKTNNSAIALTHWNENGDGHLAIGPASFAANLQAPGFCHIPAANDSFDAPSLCDYFYITPAGGNAPLNGSLTINAVPTDGVAGCTHTVTFNYTPPLNVCTGLTTTSNNGQVCVTPVGIYNGPYTWIINSVPQLNNTTNCATIDANDTYYVEATDAQTPSICSAKYSPPPVGNQCISLIPTINGNQYCMSPNPANSNPSGLYTWIINSVQQANTSNCSFLSPTDSAFVFATNSQNCSYNRPPLSLPPNSVLPPTLEKRVRLTESTDQNYYATISIAQFNDIANSQSKEVTYKLDLINNQLNTAGTITTTILDDISKGNINGKPTGTIDFVLGSTVVTRANGANIPVCSLLQPTNCYTGEIGQPSGLKLNQVSVQPGERITITYRGRINNSKITAESCNADACQEKYPNTARTTNTSYNTTTILSDVVSNQALVQIFCQYIITRAAGDVFLEQSINSGIDISQCSEYKNTTGLLIRPNYIPKQTAPNTGNTDLVTVNHEICSQGAQNELPTSNNNLPGSYEKLGNYYNAAEVSKNFSSSICAVKLVPGAAWSKNLVVDNIKANKTRVSRWGANLQGQAVTINNLNENYGSTNGVLHKIGGSLTINSSETYKGGAKTVIIEDGDLIITKDVLYDQTASKSTNIRKIPSLAFIVLNGNVKISSTVKEIDAVIFVQGNDATKGKLQALDNTESNEQLKIYGSVFGNINELFDSRTPKYLGSKTADEAISNNAGILIRFDERIILNTPPGLKDVLKESQFQVAR